MLNRTAGLEELQHIRILQMDDLIKLLDEGDRLQVFMTPELIGDPLARLPRVVQSWLSIARGAHGRSPGKSMALAGRAILSVTSTGVDGFASKSDTTALLRNGPAAGLRRASDPPGKGRPGPGLSHISQVSQTLPSRLAGSRSALAETPIGSPHGSLRIR